MGFFSKLFGSKKQKPAVSSRTSNSTPKNTTAPKKDIKQNNFITNTADHGLGDIQLGIAGKLRVDGLLAIARMEEIAKKRNLEFDFGVLYTSLLEEGALTVPVVCSIGETKYSIYFIYTEEELLKYKDLVNHIDKTEYPNLIYFSSIPIYDGYTPKPIIEPFQLADLRYDKSTKTSGTYAMWSRTNQDPTFHESKTCDILTKMNEINNGYETYLVGYVLRQTRISGSTELQRTSLPTNHVSYIIEGPEQKKIILDLSQEKGIRFLFPIAETTTVYRERFLKGAMIDMAATAIPLRQQQYPKDEKLDPNSYDWFSFMSRMVKQKEVENESIDMIGIMETGK